MAEEMLGRIIDGKYCLLSPLGRGAMGVVYRAEQLDVEGQPLRDVALKMMQPELSTDPDFSQRFLREIRVAARLRSPHTVTVHDCGRTEEGHVYFAMELIYGSTLKDVFEQHGALPVARVANIGDQICQALDEAHHLPEPIVHRDLKPANIFLETQQGRDWVKVGDFGIAKVLGEQTSGLTRTGASPGTPRYMAPEQCLGRAVDHRADLYALGILLYEMLTGRTPFSADEGPLALMYQHLNEPLPPLPVSIPAEVRRQVERLLAKDPRDRPPDALSVGRALLAAAAGTAEQTAVHLRKGGNPAPVEKKRARGGAAKEQKREKSPSQVTSSFKGKKSRPLLVGVLGTLALFVGGLWYLLRPPPVQQPAGKPRPTALPQPASTRDAAEPRPPAEQQMGVEEEEQPRGMEQAAKEPQQNTEDMVPIPAGAFWMGCNEERDQECRANEKPGQEVFLNAFSIDRREVTVAEYGRCVRAGQCSTQGLANQDSCNWGERARSGHPINCVDWYQAQAYCRWAEKRLPTEAEWEKAARGRDGRKYPWGDRWANKANFGEDGTVVVGSYASGVSPYGVHDMAGNVWEWGGDGYKIADGREFKPLRGGSWGNRPDSARTSFRTWFVPSYRSARVGIRCAR